MVSEVLDSQNNWFKDFFKDFTVSDNLDLKDLTSAELLYGLMDLQYLPGLLFRFLMNTLRLRLIHHLNHIPWTFLHYFLNKGGNIWTIGETGQLVGFLMEILVQGTQAKVPKWC